MRPRSALLPLASVILGALVLIACASPVEVTITWESETPEATEPPASGATERPEATSPTPPPQAHAPGPITGSSLFFRLRTAPPVELEIPRLGVSVPVQPVASVIDGGQWHWPVPADAAGHLLGSANPGEPGNIAITGHVDTRDGPGIFARLAELRPGDSVIIRSADGEFVYQVVETFVIPEDDVSVLRQTGSEVLTLITCIPDGVYAHRLVVRAQRASSPVL
ncbi:sortase [Thermomicrobiaceae bacterium CFH 74404]|uniref:Sortase n=1 Tax=Thermalbibacter longus TaxID=2951981 RepID=A0AA41WFN8_9BACT|nr:sortase [Thermalbibacter longus]MCM8749724.1 sortase [Thermalbibacter longus]